MWNSVLYTSYIFLNNGSQLYSDILNSFTNENIMLGYAYQYMVRVHMSAKVSAFSKKVEIKY